MNEFLRYMGVLFSALMGLGLLAFVWGTTSDFVEKIKNYREARVAEKMLEFERGVNATLARNCADLRVENEALREEVEALKRQGPYRGAQGAS